MISMCREVAEPYTPFDRKRAGSGDQALIGGMERMLQKTRSRALSILIRITAKLLKQWERPQDFAERRLYG